MIAGFEGFVLPKEMSLIKNIFLFLAACFLAAAMLEAGLRVATPFPVTEDSNKKSHPELVYTLDPALADVDALGFRNVRRTFDEADLAVIGDSHAYGVNVAAERNFPSLLEAKTGRKVYNLGVSSYGVYQYQVLIDEAIARGVRDIVVALYPANDLALNCEVLRTGYWRDRGREQGLTLPDCEKTAGERPSAIGALKAFLAGTATLQIALELIWKPVVAAGGPSAEDYFLFDRDQAVSKERVRGHAGAAALDDPDVRVNFENSKRLFLDSQASAADESIGFSITIVPSKERVLHAWTAGRGAMIDEAFAGLVQSELDLVRAYEDFFDAHDIAYADALPDVLDAFERVLQADGDFYPLDDGHPFEEGYDAYAAAALRGLDRSRERLRVTKAH